MSHRYYAIATVLASMLAQGAVAQAPEKDASLSQILRDWQDRQGLVKSARYVIVGTTEFKDAPLPPGNPVRPLRYVLLLDFEHNRYRQESSEEVIYGADDSKLKYVSRIHTSAFDGKTAQALYHRAANGLLEEESVPDLAIAKGEQGRMFQFDPNLWPVFFAHGLVPTDDSGVRADKLSLTYDAENLEMRGRQTFNGRTCTVVRTEPEPGMVPCFDEIWIDQSQKGAVYRHVNFAGSNPWNRLDVEWKQTDLGWWPGSWTKTWTANGQVRRIQRLRIESFEPNAEVADSDFTFPVEPGMKVRVANLPPAGAGLDPNFAATKTYLISPSGAWEETSAKGFTTLDGKVLPPERGYAWIWWVSAAVVGIGAIAFMYYLVRLRLRKA